MPSPLVWIPLLAAVWVAQSIFVFYQGKAFALRISRLRHEGRVAIGLAHSRIRVRTFVIVVADRGDRVVKVETLSGFTVFARPRTLPRYAGLPLTELVDVVRANKAPAHFLKAVDQAVQALLSPEPATDGAVMPGASHPGSADSLPAEEGGGPIAQRI